MNILKSLGGGSGGGRSPGGSSSEPIQVGSHSVYVGSKIAEGGFAYVYKATDASTGTPYALKLLLVPSREHLAVVQQEIDIMASLPKHPNLVEFIDADVSQDGRETQVRILMEMCADGQVVDLMNARGAARLEEDEIFDIFSQMCAGVEVLHRQTPPIAHRDLKVENLLIARHGYKLCDFGSCTMNHLVPSNAHERSDVEDDIQKNTTMAYRAPEMLDLYSDKFICEKVDVWALGCVLYKLAFYVTPFEDGGSLKILNVKYKIPSSSRYSSQLHDFIKYMLNPDPAERPDIWDVIERVCTIRGVPVFATRPEGMENRGHVSFESVPVVTASRPRRPSFGEAAESPAGAPSSGGGGGGGGGAPAVKAGGGLFQMLDWQSGGGSGGSGGGGGGGGGGGQVAAASDPFGPAAGGDPFGPSTGTDPFGPTSTTADPFGPSSGGSADPFGTATGGTSTASLGATDPFNMSGGASGGGGASPLQQSSNDPFGSAPPSPFPPSSSASADAVFGGPATATSVSGGSPAGHAADPFGSTPSDPFAPAPQPAAGGSSGGGAVVDPFGPSSADPFPPVSGGSGSGGPRAGGGGGGDPFGGAGFGGPTERPDPFAATETAVARQQPPPRSVSAVQSTNSGARGATPIEAELLDAFGGSGGMLTLPEPGAGSQSKGHSRSSSVASDWRESGGRFAADADLSDESDSDDDTAAPAAGSSTSAAAYPRETTGTSGGLLAGLGERMKNAFASEYEKALIKATDTSLRGPKRKHVRNLIIRTWEDERVGDFYHALSKRPVLTDGTVAMKALSVVHCLLMEAHPSFLVGAGDNIQIFKEMRTVWKSRASDSAALVSAYAEFLVRKIEFHGNYTDVEGNYSIDDYLQHVEAEGGTPKRTGRGTIISGDAIEGLIAICTLGDALRKIAFADIGPAQEMKLSIMITVVEDSFNAYLTMTYLMAHLISFVTPSVFARLLRLYTDCYHSMRQFLMNADDATAISNIITVPQLPSELPVFQKGKEPDVHPPFSTNPAVFKSAAAHRPDLKVVRDKEQSEGLLPASPAAAAAASQAAKAKSPKSPKSPKSGDGKGLLNRSGSFSGIFKRQNYDNIDAQSDSSGGGGDGDGGDDGWVYADGEEASGSDFDEDEDADPFGGAGGAGFATLDDSATLDAAFPPPASNAGGGAGGDPFGPSTGDPFSAQAADPFGAPASDPFGGSSDPFPAPSKRLSGDRSAAPW